jgi:3-methyladenine DNA glycosylase Tag
MRDFNEIIAAAAAFKGGIGALEAALAETPALAPAVIAATPDDRILAAMTRRIFYAGFSAKVIDAKWEAFEAAFARFDPTACAFVTEAGFDALVRNGGIVRNGAKIRSVQVNAKLLLELAGEHGSAARCFADWPDSNYAGLLDLLKTRGSHLGGDAAMRFLRAIGKPAFLTTPDVVAALIAAGVIEHAPGGKRDLAAIQAAFNTWSRQSGRNLTEISRILAISAEAARGSDAPTHAVRSRQPRRAAERVGKPRRAPR